MRENIKVLLVLPGEDLDALAENPALESLELVKSRNCAEARKALATGSPVDVVVSGLTLDDGNWLCVLKELARRGSESEIIVAAPHHDADFSEILAHGVYAVLEMPLEGKKLARVIEDAAAVGA